MFTETMTQALPFLDAINTSAPNNFTLNSVGVDMQKVKRVIYYIYMGTTFGGNGLLDGRLQSAAALTFATVHNIAGTNITELSANNTWTSTEVRSDQVTSANSGDRYVRLNLTSSGATINALAAMAIGGDAIQRPGSQYNINSTAGFVTGVVSTV